MGCLLVPAVVSAFLLPLAAAGQMDDNSTIVLNLAFVTSNTGSFVCNGKQLRVLHYRQIAGCVPSHA